MLAVAVCTIFIKLIGSVTGFLLTALLKEHVHYAPMEVPQEINATNAGN